MAWSSWPCSYRSHLLRISLETLNDFIKTLTESNKANGHFSRIICQLNAFSPLSSPDANFSFVEASGGGEHEQNAHVSGSFCDSIGGIGEIASVGSQPFIVNIVVTFYQMSATWSKPVSDRHLSTCTALSEETTVPRLIKEGSEQVGMEWRVSGSSEEL